ncbi:MAG: aminotransferase class V-fold PLP-dependent enzyme [Proteobacteria bacterium]|nr:aminotransferase class V-fold PLP-dependent enzyme [Pseudomonadota bacterium]
MPSPLAQHWRLDPDVRYLNHGSYGACPAAVLAVQSALRDELEREPVAFLSTSLPARLAEARAPLAAFLGADPDDLAFVPNATSGVNTVLRSLPLGPGDEILLTSHGYAACRLTAEAVAADRGARVVEASLPFPVGDPAAIVAAVLGAVTPRTRLALLDHVTSPTALVLPIATLVAELAARGVDTLVDGAHAPGMVPVALDALGAAYYTGNAHKWLCAPKGAAFLHVRRDRQGGVHPLVTSHGRGRGFRAEFDWTGTDDPTPWLAIPAALATLGGLVPGGWPAVMAANRALACRAREILCARLAVAAPAPEAMLGSMASLPLPAAAPGSPAASLDPVALGEWCRARGVRTWLYGHPRPLVRISAQLYNAPEDYAALADLLAEALGAG